MSMHQPIEGNKLVISCTAESNPQITNGDIKWTKMNNITFQDTGQLVIENVDRGDSGTYICTVTLNLKPTEGTAIDVIGTTSVEVDVLCKYHFWKIIRFGVVSVIYKYKLLKFTFVSDAFFVCLNVCRQTYIQHMLCKLLCYE